MASIPQNLNKICRLSRKNMITIGWKSFSRILHTGFVYNIPRVYKTTDSPLSMASKYKSFEDRSSPVILDMIEEAFVGQEDIIEKDNEFEGINLKRGATGVFDINDIVALMHRENALNVYVAALPQEINYVEYICIVTGKSRRHSVALAEFVKRVHKKKRFKTDAAVKIEGIDSKEWIALDLGNIALHIFEAVARKTYDLESLWAVGPKYDAEFNKKSETMTEFIDNHSQYLQDLIPLDENEIGKK